ncbi:MAG: AmmeMemoRadiSam system protein B [Candidatus Micrarchaeota archaeon]|nr:AmmeMemoRadiSam system protein B [Candidatus Micrarchaeota archaeon]
MRNAVASGSMYPADADELSGTISELLNKAVVNPKDIGNAVAYIAPHADYKYSGLVAAHAYKALSLSKALKDVDTFVIVGPNHNGIGTRISVSKDSWQTPLGEVEIDNEFADELLAMSVGMLEDEEGHRLEHSIEVQLPFLQSIVKRPKCCFISMLDQTEDASRAVAQDVDAVRKRLNRDIMFIATSDLNHDESADIAMEKDTPLLEKLSAFDTKGFYSELNNRRDSACGFGPMAAAEQYSKQRKARTGKMLKYATSGDVTGDRSSVVGYASMAFA